MDVLAAWKEIPERIGAVVDGGVDLDEPFGPERLGVTRRQLVHHVAEANVVAASIVIAALGSPGATYDWSWMMPFGPWLERLDYARRPVEPARRLLAAINVYVAALVEALPDGLDREVYLRDTPDGEPRRATVADVLRQEVEHVQEHLER
jgi:hypothetical protein